VSKRPDCRDWKRTATLFLYSLLAIFFRPEVYFSILGNLVVIILLSMNILKLAILANGSMFFSLLLIHSFNDGASVRAIGILLLRYE